DTTIMVRREKPLMYFDHCIIDALVECMQMTEINIKKQTNITKVEKTGSNLKIKTYTDKLLEYVDTLICENVSAPNTNNISIENNYIRI
ncbi:NAD-binding protein, partial [Francisella tularensis]|uniref:NAD-binding protein n=1 Tax=Francisella tularensis TaxID=263 RepID=UPI002381A6AA